MDFFQERKLLVARRRTNEISGENLTNVFARTYTRRRITPIPIEFPDFSQFSGKIGGGGDRNGEREKKKEKEIDSVARVRGIDSTRDYLVANRRFRHDPGNRSTDLISWISPALKRTTDEKREGNRGNLASRAPRFFTSPSSPSCLRENRLSRINQSHP